MTEQTAAQQIADLTDALRERDRRISDLKGELEEMRDLVHRMGEHIKDCESQTEAWIESFDMVLGDDGAWHWKQSFVEGHEWLWKYVTLQRKWNKFVGEYNAAIRPRNVGRPLDASEAQQAEVLKRRKHGESLRGIAEEMNLGLRTVRTIIEKSELRDRSTRKRLERIDPDRATVAKWHARKRTREALPRRINKSLETGRALLKEAKGLGE